MKHLGTIYGTAVSPEDVMAYIAALIAHPDFTSHFVKDLRQPGLRVPITKDANLFAKAAALGREVIWLHCYGERMADPKNGRKVIRLKSAAGFLAILRYLDPLDVQERHRQCGDDNHEKPA